MKDRKPYEIKNILLVYNFCQTLFSLWMFGEGWSFYISGNYRSTLHLPLLARNSPHWPPLASIHYPPLAPTILHYSPLSPTRHSYLPTASTSPR